VSASRWTAAEALPGRDSPNASEAPSGRVEAGNILIELERRGLWVQVETPQGKHLWVDGRRLQTAAPAAGPDGSLHEEDVAPTEAAPEPAPPPVQPAAWTATHAVPQEGLQAWAQPDPAGAVIANLDGRVELRIIERRSDWAHVDAENGWKGWVDGRRIVAVGGTTPPPQQPAPAMTATDKPSAAKSISLRSVAAFLVPISVFLPWFGSFFGSGSFDADATDVPAAFLWSPYAELSYPNLGTVMVVVGAAVLVTEFMARYTRYRRIAAGVVVGVVALYLVQTFRAMLDYEGEFTTAVSTMFTEALAIGPLVALAAGITLLVKRPTKPGVTGA
jgi:hypothetical protein